MIGGAQWLGLGVATMLGAVIGVERELAGQPAGLRTHALVALGSALFTIVGLAFALPNGATLSTDTARVAAALVAGIGFLGAGAVVRSERGVAGLTTAATLWATAAVGFAAGVGFYLLAAGSVGLMLLVLRGLNFAKDWLHGKMPSDRQ